VQAFASNKFLKTLVLNECSGNLSTGILTGLQMHTALVDIAGLPDSFKSSANTWIPLGDIIQAAIDLVLLHGPGPRQFQPHFSKYWRKEKNLYLYTLQELWKMFAGRESSLSSSSST
jgi:hypothetical protein